MSNLRLSFPVVASHTNIRNNSNNSNNSNNNAPPKKSLFSRIFGNRKQPKGSSKSNIKGGAKKTKKNKNKKNYRKIKKQTNKTKKSKSKSKSKSK